MDGTIHSSFRSRCKSVLITLGTIFLLFFAVPININPPPNSLGISFNNTIQLYDNYVKKFNKTYRTDEVLKLKKYIPFKESIDEIKQLNLNRSHNSSAIFGLTKFSDLSKDEFVNKYLRNGSYQWINNTYRNKLYFKTKLQLSNTISSSTMKELPLKLDWRTKNVLTKIKNQKDCGACWAFSSVETVESMNAIKRGKLEELSVQQLIDCAGYDNNGCNGGDICTILYWLDDNSIEIERNDQYPLKWKSDVCQFNRTIHGVSIADFSCNSFVGNEKDLLRELQHGPVAVAVNALLWQNYLGGIIHYHCDSYPILMNHAVQLVGYDLTAEIPHYIVRNSWGVDFGDRGYMYIAYGSNMCGLANEVVSLDVK